MRNMSGEKKADQKKSNLLDLYNRLIAINQEAFQDSYFDIAYHALAGALHCAKNIEDEQALKNIRQLAIDQLAWIDQYSPSYQHSTKSAITRGHQSIFTALVVQAEGHMNMRRPKKVS